jgi:hypothetical protein
VQTKGQQQFDLGTFSQEPSTDYGRAARYGQQTLPGLSQSTSDLPQRTPGATSERSRQLPMFMSQREIMRDYQPLDGDRQETYQEREGEATNRKFTTDGYPNRPIRANDRNAPWLQRQGTAGRTATHYRDFSRPESDDEMMSRKLDESQMSYEEYADVHSGGPMRNATPSWGTIMAGDSAPQYQSGHTETFDNDAQEYGQRKVDEHYRNSPGHGSLFDDLAHDMRPGGEGFRGVIHLATGQFGQSGKPSIAGAHHRIAAMGEIDPDRLLPVIHHNRMADARHGRSDENWPYT